MEALVTNPRQRRQQACRHDGLLQQVCSSNLHILPMCLAVGLHPNTRTRKNSVAKRKQRQRKRDEKYNRAKAENSNHHFPSLCRISGYRDLITKLLFEVERAVVDRVIFKGSGNMAIRSRERSRLYIRIDNSA